MIPTLQLGQAGLRHVSGGGGGGGGAAYRWYRILVTANNGHLNYLAICEVELRATLGGADQTTPAAAAAGAATASDVEASAGWSVSPKWAFDDSVVFTGAASAQWLSNNSPPSVGTPKWLKYDAGSPIVVAQVALTASHSTDSNPSTTAPKDFIIQGSNDDSAWTDLLAPGSQTGWAPAEQRLFNL